LFQLTDAEETQEVQLFCMARDNSNKMNCKPMKKITPCNGKQGKKRRKIKIEEKQKREPHMLK